MSRAVVTFSRLIPTGSTKVVPEQPISLALLFIIYTKLSILPPLTVLAMIMAASAALGTSAAYIRLRRV